MDVEISNESVVYTSDFPQHLCKMCGKCCKAITTPYTHEELVQLAAEGQEEAKVFVDIFERYSSVEEAKKAVPDHVENILNFFKKGNPDFDESKITFYHCPHITEDNLCSIHSTRPDCCRRAPRNGWSLFPPNCGFKGWQFLHQEKAKASVRKLKEYLLELELLPDSYYLKERNMTVLEMKEFINSKIRPWEKYGATVW